MTPEQAAALRAPFPRELIGQLPSTANRPKLDYVGHAAVTDRLLSVDPEWTWDFYGTGSIDERGNDSVLWIALTVCGVTRIGVGIVASKSFELEKQLISDAIRNAAMRFGVALDLWSKEDLHANENAEAPGSAANSERVQPVVAQDGPVASATSPARRSKLKSRCSALLADGVSVADEREKLGLPLVDGCNEDQLTIFETLVSSLEAKLEAPFTVDA